MTVVLSLSPSNQQDWVSTLLVPYAIHFLVIQNCTDENKIKDRGDWGMLLVNSKQNSLVDSRHDYSLSELSFIQSSK